MPGMKKKAPSRQTAVKAAKPRKTAAKSSARKPTAKKETARSAKLARKASVRIVVVKPVPGVAYAVQRGRSELLVPARVTETALVFEFFLTVADVTSHPPRLTGQYAHGPPAARFVYVNSGTMAGQDGSCWERRAKVPLDAIPPALLAKAADRSDVFVEASIRGDSKDGGPACATVPLLSGWTLVEDKAGRCEAGQAPVA